MSCGISSSFPEVFPTSGQVTHVLLTRPPLDLGVAPQASLDLHVLSTPPAFILSQDQTLMLNSLPAVALARSGEGNCLTRGRYGSALFNPFSHLWFAASRFRTD